MHKLERYCVFLLYPTFFLLYANLPTRTANHLQHISPFFWQQHSVQDSGPHPSFRYRLSCNFLPG